MSVDRAPGGGAHSRPRTVIGRYALYPAFASGGMASVHFARLLGDVGFTRVVAIKRLHEQFAKDADFAAMLLDEARLAANIHHPNVVATLDVLATDDELFLVMEYVRGESLDTLLRAAAAGGTRIRPEHAVAVVVGALHGLHAAHEAKSPAGQPLGIVHRDVSPQNILVGEDGVARIIDFGIAKAVERVHSTRDGELRGKIGYMAPEQLENAPVDRRADVYAASVVLWEALTHKKYIDDDNAAARLKAALDRKPEPPSAIAPDVPRALDAIVLRGLARQPSKRFGSALEMAAALESAIHRSSQSEVGAWVSQTAAETLHARVEALSEIEREEASSAFDTPPPEEGSGRSLSRPPPPPSRSSRPPSRPPPPPSQRTQPSQPSPPPPSPPSLVAMSELRAMSAPVPTPQSFWQRAAFPAAVLALLGATIVAIFVVRDMRKPESVELPGPDVPGMGPAFVPGASTAVTAAAETAAAVAEAPTAASAAVASAVGTTAPTTTKATPAASARVAPRRGCNPPYTMDHGIKVPKLECL